MEAQLLRKKSRIHGFGIFATTPIKAGCVFYQVPTSNIVNKPRPRYAFIGNGRWVCDDGVLNWVNHSCDANTKLDLQGNVPVLIATRDIAAGEEITCNYNETETNGSEVACNCGSAKCKGRFLRKE